MDTTNLTENDWVKTKYDGYFININGQVKKIMKTKEKLCHLINGKNGYLVFSAGKKHKPCVHRVMGETFLQNPHNLRNIDHIDRNKTNNHISNLRWFSQQDNMLNRQKVDGCYGVIFSIEREKWLAKSGQYIIGEFMSENEARACKYGYLRAKQITIELQ
jgi:hypothetical protein